MNHDVVFLVSTTEDEVPCDAVLFFVVDICRGNDFIVGNIQLQPSLEIVQQLEVCFNFEIVQIMFYQSRSAYDPSA